MYVCRSTVRDIKLTFSARCSLKREIVCKTYLHATGTVDIKVNKGEEQMWASEGTGEETRRHVNDDARSR